MRPCQCHHKCVHRHHQRPKETDNGCHHQPTREIDFTSLYTVADKIKSTLQNITYMGCKTYLYLSSFKRNNCTETKLDGEACVEQKREETVGVPTLTETDKKKELESVPNKKQLETVPVEKQSGTVPDKKQSSKTIPDKETVPNKKQSETVPVKQKQSGTVSDKKPSSKTIPDKKETVLDKKKEIQTDI